ncbi:30S ribosomal protein S6 [Candidatus Nardonella dryophthoridicola]
MKKFSYIIKNMKEGRYILIKINSLPINIKKINNEFKLNNNILRNIIIKI